MSAPPRGDPGAGPERIIEETVGRVAVLADVHANPPALEAVLADLAAVGAELVVFAGDTVSGPLPAETAELVVGLGDRAVWVHGNTEREILAAADGSYVDSGDPFVDDSARWGATHLSTDQLALIRDLPLTVRFDVAGVGPVLVAHASPRRDDELLLVDTPATEFAAALAGVTEPTIVLGHTHMPFDRLVDRHRVVNAGSVGMPYGHTGASWLLLGPGIELRRTGYDAPAAAARLRASRLAGVDELVRENVLTVPSDLEALEVFHRRGT